jgi:ABC-type transport system involved in multi-copper enzyme maturation permease subunit
LLPAPPILAAAAGGTLDYFIQNAGYFIGAAIILVGLLYGVSDIARLSPVRAGAIARVSFDESIRRRVLWVTPVAIVGIVAVAQFLDPVDPQDALRQTTKVCLFATGLVVVITGIILACTNLPKEIDSRVIYTIVTKPTTRLEIVLGKVLGFAMVSAVILLIMGAFSLSYLKLREWRTRAWIREQLASDKVDPQFRNAFQLYAQNGLLVTKSLAQPAAAHVAAEPPVEGQPVVLAGAESQFFAVPFELTAEQKNDVRAAQAAGGGMFILNKIGFRQRIPTPEEAKTIHDLRLPTATVGGDSGASQGSLLPSLPTLAAVQLPIPQVSVHVFNKQMEKLVDDKLVNEGKPVSLPPNGEQPRPMPAFLNNDALEPILAADRFYVMVEVTTPTVSYLIDDLPTFLAYTPSPDTAPKEIDPAPNPADPSKPTPPTYEANRGKFGMQLRGRSDGKGVVAIFPFDNVSVPPAPDGRVAFELNVGMESTGDYDKEGNIAPLMLIQVRNRSTGKATEPTQVRIETNRVVPVTVPAEFVSGGNFDVYLRGLNDGAWFGVEKQSLSLVRDTEPFSWNLLKGLFVLWLMAVLVVAIAVFCSTFLSWPIAVVLTLFILLGHWSVTQLGDVANAGLGNEVTSAMGLDDPAAARIVRGSVNFLTGTLNFIAQFLPDVSKFPVTEDIERGVSMPAAKVGAAAWVLLGYGLPVTLLGYMILRNKEVAP